MHVPKEKKRIVMLVDRFRIVGDMHHFPGARMMDLVNVKDNAFFPVTDAEIFSLADGKLLHKAAFVGVCLNAVSFFYPVEDQPVEDQPVE